MGNQTCTLQIFPSDTPVPTDFIEACCKVEPEERLTADEALKHPWLLNELSRGTHDIGTNVRDAFRDRIRRTGSLVESDRTRDLEPHERENSGSSASTPHEQEVCPNPAKALDGELTVHRSKIPQMERAVSDKMANLDLTKNTPATKAQA